MLMRYHGELSECIDQALMSFDLRASEVMNQIKQIIGNKAQA